MKGVALDDNFWCENLWLGALASIIAIYWLLAYGLDGMLMQLILLGPPGAGKGTQAAILAERWQVPHVSTGDILREAIAAKTPMGIEAKSRLETGELLPDETILGLMRDRFSQSDMTKGWILDGFPRTMSQARALDSLIDTIVP